MFISVIEREYRALSRGRAAISLSFLSRGESVYLPLLPLFFKWSYVNRKKDKLIRIAIAKIT